MNKARQICNNFLIGLDGFLKDNLDSLTCADVNNIYSDFYTDLKEYKGNSNGFTGLSEYLIFRFIYHLLGCSFKKEQISPMLYAFTSEDYKIGQNIPIIVNSARYYPDVLIYKNGNPVLIIEIKLYLTNGVKTLMGDINKLKKITSAYPGSKGLFISYNIIPEKGKIYKKLNDEINLNNQLNYLILAYNNELLKDELEMYF